jgi:hypothetical protein
MIVAEKKERARKVDKKETLTIESTQGLYRMSSQ